jgi:hypothetical protein
MRINQDTMIMIGMTGNEEGFTRSNIYVSYFNNEGRLFGTKTFVDEDLSGTGNDAYKIIQLTDGRIVVLSVVHSCDFYWPVHLAMIDPVNGVEWKHDTYLWHGQDSYSLSQADQNTIRISDGSLIQYFNLEGSPITPHHDLPYTSNLVPYFTGHLAAMEDWLVILDSKFQIAGGLQFRTRVQGISRFGSDQFAVLTQDSLYLLNSELERVRSRFTPLWQAQIIASGDSSLWVAHSTKIRCMNTELEVEQSYTMPAYMTLSDLLVEDDRLFINGLHKTTRNSAALFITSHADSLHFNFKTQVRLAGVRYGDDIVYQNWWSNPVQYKIHYGHVFVTLENTGTTLLDSVTVRFKRKFEGSICYVHERQLSWTLRDLNLNPGMQKEYYLDSISICCFTDPFEQLCLWTTGPNGEPDPNTNDDLNCGLGDFVSPVSAITPSAEIQIFPNPSSGTFTIQRMGYAAGTTTRISIANQIGQQVESLQLWSDHMTLALPPGLYVISIRDNAAGQSVHKLLIQ